MRQHTFAFACLCSLAAITFVSAVPLPADDRELDVLQIPLENGKEIDVLTLGAKDQEQMIADRNKRTVGLLRELFPDLTKEIDSIVNRIIAQVIRVVGPSLLPTLLGNRSPTPRSNTFDADFDDDDEDSDSSDSDSNGNGGDDDKTDLGTNSIPKGFATRTNVQIDLPTFQQEGEEVSTTPASNAAITNKNGATDTQIDLSAINKQLEETIRVARQVKEAEAAAQAVASSQQQPQQLPIPASNEPIQLSFNNEVTPSLNALSDNSKSVNNDLQSSESKSPAIDELTLDSNEDTADLDDRNKRFLSFGGAGLAGGSSGGSNAGAGGAGAAPGGSGNFLFDIVRLFSGSVQTQAGDESANSANSVSGSGDGSGDDADTTRAADGYTEGIPGPVTRLVVLANRGLANLVQDLILRVAATSEKFVNFKAKLITALI